MVHRLLGDLKIRIERVWVIAQAADADTVFVSLRPHVVGLSLGEAGHIDMGHAGEFAFRLADRPAHQFDIGELLGLGELKHLFQRQVREDGRDESEFHSDDVDRWRLRLSAQAFDNPT